MGKIVNELKLAKLGQTKEFKNERGGREEVSFPSLHLRLANGSDLFIGGSDGLNLRVAGSSINWAR